MCIIKNILHTSIIFRYIFITIIFLINLVIDDPSIGMFNFASCKLTYSVKYVVIVEGKQINDHIDVDKE